MAKVCVATNLLHGVKISIKDKDGNLHKLALNGSKHQGAIGGWGITENVDDSFIDTWLKKFFDLEFVKRKQIFIGKNRAECETHAKAEEGMKHGLERLTPKDMPKGVEIRSNV